MGSGKYGRLGHGDEDDKKHPTLIKELEDKQIIEVKAGHYHSMAISKKGEIYTWGNGKNGRLGQGFDEAARVNPSTSVPKLLDSSSDLSNIVNADCGKNINAVALKSGAVYSWGKGDHEKPKFEDFIEYSTPFPMIEDKKITYVCCGYTHVMVID